MPHTVELLRSLSESNIIARFERLLAEAPEDETRTTLHELIAEERKSMKRLPSSVQQRVEEISGFPGPL